MFERVFLIEWQNHVHFVINFTYYKQRKSPVYQHLYARTARLRKTLLCHVVRTEQPRNSPQSSLLYDWRPELIALSLIFAATTSSWTIILEYLCTNPALSPATYSTLS